MKIGTVVLQSTLALLAADSLAMSVPVHADPISGAFTVKVAKQEVLPVTEQSGDMLMLVESHGTNKSSNWMDDAQVVNKEIDSAGMPEIVSPEILLVDMATNFKWSGIIDGPAERCVWQSEGAWPARTILPVQAIYLAAPVV
jgi:hypothetical protein